jgi:hypothetical protein
VGTLVLMLILEEMVSVFQFFTVKYDVGYRPSYIAFTILRYIPSIPSFLELLSMKLCWILSKSFSVSR